MRSLGWTDRVCERCGAAFRVRTASLKHTPRRFCSVTCSGRSRRGAEFGAVPRSELIRLYRDEGMTLAAIAERFGMSLSNVADHLRKAGVPRRGPSSDNMRTPAALARQRENLPRGTDHHSHRDIPMDAVIADYLSGYGCPTLAFRYGVSPATITKRLRLAGIPIRPSGFGGIQQAKDGHTVRSGWERIVDDWLSERGIEHAVEPAIPFAERGQRADFFAHGYYIEVWGVSNHDWYERRKAEKIAHYKAHDLPLIEITPADIQRTDFSALALWLT